MTLRIDPSEASHSAVLDDAHIGHIHGALGTIHHGDTARARIGSIVSRPCSQSSAPA